MTFRRDRYPANWPVIRASILRRALDACECRGHCGETHGPGARLVEEEEKRRCLAPNSARIVRDPSAPWRWWPAGHEPRHLNSFTAKVTRVVLTVAHLNHREDDNDPSNLLALCQRCHLLMDGRDNRARRQEALDAARGQLPLPALAVMPEHRRTAR